MHVKRVWYKNLRRVTIGHNVLGRRRSPSSSRNPHEQPREPSHHPITEHPLNPRLDVRSAREQVHQVRFGVDSRLAAMSYRREEAREAWTPPRSPSEARPTLPMGEEPLSYGAADLQPTLAEREFECRCGPQLMSAV